MSSFIWITGASSGIGRALALQFAANGYEVFATARNAEKLLELANSASGLSGSLITEVCDMNATASIDAALQKFFSVPGREIGILINNAGVTSFRGAMDDSWETVQNIIQTNVLGPIYAIRKVLPDMLAREKGTIINILSVVCKKTFTRSSIYSASKSALEAYANVLREEVRKKQIQVLNVYPGATITGIWPEHVVTAQREKMMQAEHVASVLVDMVISQKTAFAEELVLRPVTGDL